MFVLSIPFFFAHPNFKHVVSEDKTEDTANSMKAEFWKTSAKQSIITLFSVGEVSPGNFMLVTR